MGFTRGLQRMLFLLLPPFWSPSVLLLCWEGAEHLQGGTEGSSELRLRKLCLELSFLLGACPGRQQMAGTASPSCSATSRPALGRGEELLAWAGV